MTSCPTASRIVQTPVLSSHLAVSANLRSPHALSLLADGCRELSGLLLNISHPTNHVECILWILVARTRKLLFKVADRRLQIHKLARSSSEDLSDKEGLGEETLHLASPRHSELILLTQLIHTKNCNDVLQRLVILQDFLRAARTVV